LKNLATYLDTRGLPGPLNGGARSELIDTPAGRHFV
jgi:hypothetical protein